VLRFPDSYQLLGFSAVNSFYLSGLSSSIKSGSLDIAEKFMKATINTNNPNPPSI
jgi:hypothetical protein